jgi:homogentisate 1,2-dioxygenase
LIRGAYDGKKVGFIPGGVSLHSRFTPHGPDTATFDGATTAELEPVYYSSGLAFMFETAYYIKTTDFARHGEHREVGYSDCWKNFKRSAL